MNPVENSGATSNVDQVNKQRLTTPSREDDKTTEKVKITFSTIISTLKDWILGVSSQFDKSLKVISGSIKNDNLTKVSQPQFTSNMKIDKKTIKKNIEMSKIMTTGLVAQ